MQGGTPYRDLSAEMQAYHGLYFYGCSDRMQPGFCDADAIDTSDETYQTWTKEESISLNQYLNYAISKNWIDTSRLDEYISSERYSDSQEIYQAILKYLEEYLSSDMEFR